MESKNAIVSVADKINSKRRAEVFQIYRYKPIFDYINELRRSEAYHKGNKSKTMKLVASIPFEVDHFFSKVYGDEYFKDPEFFTKRYSEWNVSDYNPGEYEESRQNVKEMFYRAKEEEKDVKNT